MQGFLIFWGEKENHDSRSEIIGGVS